MKRVRVIPVLLLHKGGLVKSVKFKNHRYVGDPVNAVKIFNEKEVDEIVVLDIDATNEKRPPDFEKIKEIAGEAFIPLAYGGGITNMEQVNKLFYLGIEKVILNHAALQNPALVTAAASVAGSQSVVVSLDVRKTLFGKYKVYGNNGTVNTGMDPVEFALKMQDAGAGEIMLNAIERDGTYLGYDLTLIRSVSNKLKIPVIACGGAVDTGSFLEAIQQGASAVAAGSIFVFQRPHQAVLISYPSQQELQQKLFSKL